MTTKTVIANNSLGRPKEMDFDEYRRRAITDFRGMCHTAEQFKAAEELMAKQEELIKKLLQFLVRAAADQIS